MAGLCAVLSLYIVLICLASATWVRLLDGFDESQITRIACEVRFNFVSCGDGAACPRPLLSALLWIRR